MTETKRVQLENLIASQFPKHSYAEWYEKANAQLRGKSLNDYYRHTYEESNIKPLYTKEDLPKNLHQLTASLNLHNHHWKVAQLTTGKTVHELRSHLKSALNQGQDTISFQILDNLTKSDLHVLLNEIDIHNLPFWIDGQEEILPFYFLLLAWLNEENIDKNKVKGFIGWDPIASLCKEQVWNEELLKNYQCWADTIPFVKEKLPNLKTIFIDGRQIEQLGGNNVQQLAISMAIAIEHIETLKEKGLSVAAIVENMVFGFSVRSNFFLEIAKLRAARFLWTKVLEAYGLKSNQFPMTIFAETTIINKSKLDVHTNILRIGGEALSAVIGQVQALRIHPFDIVFGEQTNVSERLSRNIHHLLRDEAKLTYVKDPARGSYFIESLTNDIVEKTWTLFLEIEKAGGIFQQIKEGNIQQQLQEIKEKMIQDLNYRKTKLIGTNQYADLQEQIKDTKIAQKAVIRLFKKESIGQFMAAAENNTSLIQFFTIKSTKAQEVAFRLSEPFEKLRMAAKHITRQTGNPPTVHLLGFGELKEYKPITDFVTDFFACGGIHCQVLNEDISIDEAIMTLQLIQAQMICLCGSHCQIEKNLDEIKALIKSNSNKRFYVAGVQNNELLDKLKAAGILGHIHQQLNHYLFLEHFFTLLGGQTDATEF